MRMRTVAGVAAALLALPLVFAAGWMTGRAGLGSVVEPASLSAREQAFVERMRGASLVGVFTVAGRDQLARPDTYHIASVEKVGDERWRFNARLGAGGVHVPIVLPMQWAGDTPMVVMDDLSLPGVGTFSARVFFHDDRYAGTWQHGETGGHMYGRIEPGR
jgi:hypothetical protein